MKYRWAIQTVSIAEIEALLGITVTALSEGYFNTPTATIQGIEIEFAAPLNPGQQAQLKHYLATATREKLIEVT